MWIIRHRFTPTVTTAAPFWRQKLLGVFKVTVSPRCNTVVQLRWLRLYQAVLGWKTCQTLSWNRRAPRPKANPTQGKKWVKKVAFGPHLLFPYSKQFFVGWDWIYIGKQTARNLTHQKFILRKHPSYGSALLKGLSVHFFHKGSEC